MTVNLTQASTAPAAQDTSALRQVFEAIDVESCPYLFNFHMHTVHSDGKLQPEELMEQAVRIGLRGLAITDHHSVNGYRRAQQWLTSWLASSTPTGTENAPCLWTGTEINADLLGGDVHILAYAFDLEHDAIQPYLQGKTTTGAAYQASQIIAAIHEAGGMAVLAHPARYKRSSAELIPAIAQLGIDGVEAYYAYNNPSPWRPSPQQTEEVLQLSQEYGLLNTCGTDTHGLSLLQRL